MKRLLLVSYAFPPQRNPESLLVLATARALVQAGWIVTVLTIDHTKTPEPVDPDLMREVPPTVSVVRTGGFEHWLSEYPGLWNAMWYGFRLLGLPERQCAWYFPALHAARRLLTTQRFDAMYSWANYHVSNIVALRLHRRYGVPWVAHFSDPWTDSRYFRAPPLQRLVCARLERQILEGADAIVLVTEETRRLVLRKYPERLAMKVRIVPHGYDPSVLANLPSVEKPTPTTNRPLRLVHVGAFYPGLREPITLLRALATVHGRQSLAGRLEVRLVGPYTDRYHDLKSELNLDGVVVLRPPVGRQEGLMEALLADVLLVIDAPDEGESVFLPSKLVDYLMLRKPILGVTPRRGATARLLGELGFPLAEAADVAGIAEAVSDLLRAHAEKRLTLPPGFDAVAARYHITRTTGQLIAVLEDVVTVG